MELSPPVAPCMHVLLKAAALLHAGGQWVGHAMEEVQVVVHGEEAAT